MDEIETAPPPPPEAPAPEVDLAAAVAELARRVAALEHGSSGGDAPAPEAPPAPALEAPEFAELESLRVQNAELQEAFKTTTAEVTELRAAASAPSAPSADAEELEALKAKNKKLLDDYERIEGEYQALKLKADAMSKAPPVEKPAEPAKPTPVTVMLAKLRFQHTKLETAHGVLQKQYDALKLKETVGGAKAVDLSETAEIVKSTQLQADYDKLKKRYDELLNASDTGKVDDGSGSETIAGAVAQRQKVEANLSRIKKEASRTIRRLKEQADTSKLQKENLLKMLATRDAQESGGGKELTLEQITDSPVFKTMLGNIRRTSREEVTLLHDSVVAWSKTNPAAYNQLLVVIAAKFKAVNVENPLALLKDLPTT